MPTKAYAGIGSRQTPPDVMHQMGTIAAWLASLGFTLRSGGAGGADTAFEIQSLKKEIFRPHHTTPAALELAARFHPAWDRCSDYAKRLHARNGFQVLGTDLVSPSAFVVCWTKDGKASGGTGQAIRIANHFGIPVFNLHDLTAEARLRAAVERGEFDHANT